MLGGGGGGVGGGLPRLWQKQKLYESMSAEKRHVWTSINASKARPNDCLPVGASDSHVSELKKKKKKNACQNQSFLAHCAALLPPVRVPVITA